MYAPGAVFSRAASFLGLLHSHRELDVAVLKIDLEPIGVTRVQVGGDEVKLPVVSTIVEGNVGNIVSAAYIRAVRGASHAGQHGYRTAPPVLKDRVWVGDGVAVGVAHRELHRNGPAVIGPEHTAAVGINRRQNDVTRVRPNACAIHNH